LNPLARVAESEAELPTIIADDIVVTNVGLVVVTVSTSQELRVAGLLFVSPLYVAFQLNWPSVVNVTEGEFGTMLLTTLTENVKATATVLHVVVPFQTRYVTVPAALLVALVRLAES
jgi:hypothetical protein